MDWALQLAQAIPPGAKIGVLGVGSVLCGDDGAGMAVVEQLSQNNLSSQIRLFAGSTAPENFTGEIKKFAPAFLLVIDAAFMEKSPGTIALVDAQSIDGMGFSTHMLPMSVMLAYLRQETALTIYCIGVQPQCTEFGAPMGSTMEHAVAVMTERLTELFCRKGNL